MKGLILFIFNEEKLEYIIAVMSPEQNPTAS
jgi:hypothetical protein